MEALTRGRVLASIHPDASADSVTLQLLCLLVLSARQRQSNITIPLKVIGKLQVSTAKVGRWGMTCSSWEDLAWLMPGLNFCQISGSVLRLLTLFGQYSPFQ